MLNLLDTILPFKGQGTTRHDTYIAVVRIVIPFDVCSFCEGQADFYRTAGRRSYAAARRSVALIAMKGQTAGQNNRVALHLPLVK
jgi:hypothetical protein